MTVSSPRLLIPLWSLSAVLALAGLVAEVLGARGGAHAEVWVPFLSLSYEHNLPTWFSSSLLLACALVLALHASLARVWRAHWWGLAAGFAYLSLDEAVGLHEHLGVLELGGLLYFSWVVPAAIVVTVVGWVYLRFVRALPSALRRGVVVSFALYVGGAVGMELPLGWWTERHGNDNLTYALIDHAEELLELLGASLFLSTLAGPLTLGLREEEGAEGATHG